MPARWEQVRSKWTCRPEVIGWAALRRARRPEQQVCRPPEEQRSQKDEQGSDSCAPSGRIACSWMLSGRPSDSGGYVRLPQLQVIGGGVMDRMAALPRVVRNQEGRVQHEPHAILEPLVRRERSVAALVGDDPESGGCSPGCDGVGGPRGRPPPCHRDERRRTHQGNDECE